MALELLALRTSCNIRRSSPVGECRPSTARARRLLRILRLTTAKRESSSACDHDRALPTDDWQRSIETRAASALRCDPAPTYLFAVPAQRGTVPATAEGPVPRSIPLAVHPESYANTEAAIGAVLTRTLRCGRHPAIDDPRRRIAATIKNH